MPDEICWRCGYPESVHGRPAKHQMEPWFHCPPPLNDLEALERAFIHPAMGDYGDGRIVPVMGGAPLEFDTRHALACSAIRALHGGAEWEAQKTASIEAKQAARG